MSKRVKIGAIIKGKDGKADYIKVDNDVQLRRGMYINMESKKQQIESLSKAVQEGKLSAELGEKLLASAEKIPDFVRFELFARVD